MVFGVLILFFILKANVNDNIHVGLKNKQDDLNGTIDTNELNQMYITYLVNCCI